MPLGLKCSGAKSIRPYLSLALTSLGLADNRSEWLTPYRPAMLRLVSPGWLVCLIVVM
jgi:hypothetical protein